ncbi:MAG: PilZ domain-containing protein [Spirochaetales bacterium]|nr:PilZ domain-containing protein [Spirochaetales bacterium]
MERRKSRRITVDLPVNYSINQKARAINLSICGMKLETGKFLTKGTILFLNIYLPDEELKVIGEVRWSKSRDHGKFVNGVEFFFMDSRYEKKIKKYIETMADQPFTIALEHN